MRIYDALHDVNVQFPLVFRSPLGAIARFDKVHHNVVMFERFSEAQGSLLILGLIQFPNLIGTGCVT